MSEMVTVRRTYKYRLYRNDKRNRRLHRQINAAGWIWNHALALQKRYYKLTKRHLPLKMLKAHIAKLRMKRAKYARWKVLGSQAVQDVQERLEEAWERFFAKRGGLPRFKKVKRYKSFTLKQTAGWKLLVWNQNQVKANGKYRRARGTIEIGKGVYKFVQHRPLRGEVKTVTVKRDACRRLWLCLSVIEQVPLPESPDLSHIGGLDFGLRTFLTDDTGRRWLHPEFLRHLLHRLRVLNRQVSRKLEGSQHRERQRWLLARTHSRVADQRRDFHFKLAHALCDVFDVLVVEDLNLKAMKQLWGRKVSDLGFARFLAILRHIALLRGKLVITIGRFERTTQKCSRCGHPQALGLRDRQFTCQICGLSLDRDHNAAINIRSAGSSALRLRGSQT